MIDSFYDDILTPDEKEDGGNLELKLYKKLALTLRSNLKLDSFHWKAVIERSRKMFRILDTKGEDILLEHVEPFYQLKLPACRDCGAPVDWVAPQCDNMTIGCSEDCGWQGHIVICTSSGAGEDEQKE